MIDINTPAGAPPRELLLEAITEVFDTVMDCAAHSQRPPQLHQAIMAARLAQGADNVEGLEARLIEVAHGAIASLVRIRAAMEPGRPRPAT